MRNQNAAANARHESLKERCKKEIIEVLKEYGPMSIGELHGSLQDEGFKDHTVRNARTELYEEGRITREQVFINKKKIQMVKLAGSE